MSKITNFKKKTDSTSKTDKKVEKDSNISVGKMIKHDIIKMLWVLLYTFIIAFILYFTFSAIPFLFSYMYTSVGTLIGVDFSNMTAPDLIFWGLVSMSTGLIFVILIALMEFTLIKILTKNIVLKHVIHKKANKQK